MRRIPSREEVEFKIEQESLTYKKYIRKEIEQLNALQAEVLTIKELLYKLENKIYSLEAKDRKYGI